MSPKPSVDRSARWLVVTGSPLAGLSHFGPFESEEAAADFRDEWIAQGAESAEVAELHDPHGERTVG